MSTGEWCRYPLFWWLCPDGYEWTCPACTKVWSARTNPSRIVGGRVFWPRRAPRSSYRPPYSLMVCAPDTTEHDPWGSPQGRSLLTRMHETKPGLAAEVERGRDRRRRRHEP